MTGSSELIASTIKALEAPELKRVIDVGGFYPVASSPEEFGRFLKSDFAFQGKLLKELGLTP